MADELVFPENPYVGQVYSQNGKSWQWNGVYWEGFNQAVTDKAVKIIHGEYLIQVNDGSTVFLSDEQDSQAAFIWLTTDIDAQLSVGFRIELWRVAETIGFEAEQGIVVIAPEGNWVSKPGGRAVVMKIGESKWMIHGDVVPDPSIEYLKTESDDYIATDN